MHELREESRDKREENTGRSHPRNSTPTPSVKQPLTMRVQDEDLSTELEILKAQVDNMSKKLFELMSFMNNDKSSMNMAKLESELMDTRTEVIKLRKNVEDLKEFSDVSKLNKKLVEFKNEMDAHFKGLKSESMSAEFNTRLQEVKAELDEFKSNLADPKFSKESKKVKIKNIESLEQVTVEVQRLSDGLNNLFNFTQA